MKVSVVYASTTGNTEAMANAICEAVKGAGAELVFGTADSADKAAVLASDVILLGSPAMGDEVLEDSVEEFSSGRALLRSGSCSLRKQEQLVVFGKL